MITKINKIKDFGIFFNFSWDATINPFKKRNLIFGWNYSGKTTFSKLFSNLEKKLKLHYEKAEYVVEIKTATGSRTFTQDQLDTFPYLVKVFNSCYVKSVFSWDKEKVEEFDPILFYLGDEAGDIQPKIDNLAKRWNPKIDLIQKHFESIVNAFEEYAKENGKFSKQATEIRKYLNDQIKSNDFNKSHLIILVSEIKSDLPKHTLPADKVIEIKQQAIATNEFLEQEEIYTLSESIKKIGEKVKNILEDTAPKTIPFPELDENQNLFNWVQTGLDLHKDSTKCKFCNNDLKEERIKSLNQYYSDKLQEIQVAIKKIREEIEADRTGLNFEFPHESKIVKHLNEKYKKATKEYDELKKKYIKEIEIFESDLKKKENNYFISITAKAYNLVTVNPELQNVIDIIKEHNSFVRNFATIKKEALDIILRHFVAEFLTAENYLTKETESKAAADIVSRCQTKTMANNSEISRLTGLLKNTVKGQEELNIFLKIFLNRDDIQIDITDDKFVLKRGTHLANNLSEGEKTAIAFAYFLTELKSLKKEGKLKDTIIFFDDPVSSLDSNHIFQVRSLIQYFFSNKDNYLQLFISTHNFEFFSVMLDSNLFKNENKADVNAEKCPYYLINRTSSDASVIKNLPKTLRSHKSEYAHIFTILKDYNECTSKDTFEFKILLPNALRRFLELYSLFKYPKGFSEVDDRLKIIFSPDDSVFHNTKLYHWFSHQNQFEKISQHDSKIILIDEAISEVMDHIKNNDKLHWKGLTGEP